MITQLFNVCNKDQHDTSDNYRKSILSSNWTKFLCNLFLIYEKKPRYFIIPFALVDIKYNIVGTTFFEKHVQKINIQDFIMNFKHSFFDQPTIACIFTLSGKKFPFVSSIYQINSKMPTYLKPKTVHSLQFPLKNSKTSLLKTENFRSLLTEIPQTRFLLNGNDFFPLWENYRKNSED